MKKKFVVKGTLIALSLGFSLSSWAQVNSATMYKGTGNNYGSTGSYYGSNNSATGFRSFSGGYNSLASGNYSIGLGYDTDVTGSYSFGYGFQTDVTGHYAFSIGTRNLAAGPASFALGIDVKATADRAMVIGSGRESSNPLVNNIPRSLMVGFYSNVPTLFVGPGNGIGAYGNVGIGTTDVPFSRLTVSKLNSPDWEYGLSVEVNEDKTKAFAVVNKGAGGNLNTDLFIVWGNGVVNTKKMYSEEIHILPSAIGTHWPDYVFKKDYRLRPLSEVSDYIKLNSHLPDVPSEQEIQDEGINLGEMDAVLLRKVEELTLYILQQQEEIEELRKLIEDTHK